MAMERSIGTNQIEGLDYAETFSPVVNPISICLVLTVTLTKGWKICQIDIGNAFLNGVLEGRILMCQPVGFVNQQYPHHVCRLKKSIYGLKLSSCVWFKRLRDLLVSFGFKGSSSILPSSYTLVITQSMFSYTLMIW